jgi:hypothetical protein
VAANFDHIIQRTVTTCRDINSGQSLFEFEYFGEFQTEFKIIFFGMKLAQVGSFDEKTRGQKSHATVRLTGLVKRYGPWCSFGFALWAVAQTYYHGAELHNGL